MVATVTVHFQYEHPDQTPMVGELTFTPPPLRIPDTDQMIRGSARVVLDSTGAGQVTLIATDDPAVEPTGFTYRVVERLHAEAGREFSIALAATSPDVQLADIAPTNPDLGDYVLVEGPPGPEGLSAYQVAVANGFVGSEQDWLDSLVGGGGGGGAVDSVNGRTGAVVLAAADVGAAPAPVVFSQSTPASTWTITHGLPYSPGVAVYDNAGGELFADPHFPNATTVLITFAFPMTGSAVLH